MHGKQSMITIDPASPIFQGLKKHIPAARYHSLIAEKDSLPFCLQVIGTEAAGEIMAVKHKDYPVYGLQFHPESILTPDGETILKNFLSCKRGHERDYERRNYSRTDGRISHRTSDERGNH